MESLRLLNQIERLPASAQRLVAELVEMLSQEPGAAVRVEDTATPQGAILLPPLDVTNIPTTWPENQFANPEFYGAWADRDDITDSTEYVRELRRQHWGINP